jgi:hypothetical protein
MKTIYEYILEGQIDGLKNVKIIRHYTTGTALKKILDSGIIEPHESEGDDDWKDYPIHDKNVISFHDERTDPEWKQFIDSNNRKISMDGLTTTLALHMKKVCCCIEIDYDKLDKLIQDKTHLLNIYRTKAEHFVNLWNYQVNKIKGSNEYFNFNSIKVDLAKLIKNALKDDNDELVESLKHVWDQYKFDDKRHDDIGKLADNKIREILLKYYSNEELNSLTKDYFGREISVYDDLIKSQIGWGFGYGFPIEYNLNNVIEEYSKAANFAKREKLKPINDDDKEKLIDYLIKFDALNIIKLLRSHGWRFGDSKMQIFLGRGVINDGSNAKTDGSLLRWLDELMENKQRIVNMGIEIRIASPVLLNKDNCKIKIFSGICEATQQESLLKLPKKYHNKYVIEYIEPK